METLLLDSSYIFENSTEIDQLRQTFIDLRANQEEEEVQNFLKKAYNYLLKDIPENLLNELVSTICCCFSSFPKESLPIFNQISQNIKLNSNFTIITFSILSILTHVKPKLSIPDYYSYVETAFEEICPQIQKTAPLNLKLFDHHISPKYSDDLIIDILLSLNFTERIIYGCFRIVFLRNLFSMNPKFDSLFQYISDSGFIQILPQSDHSNQQLFEFIKNENFDSVLDMDKEAFLLVLSAVFSARNGCEVKGLTIKTVLPFMAIVLFYLKKYPNDVKYNNQFSFDDFSLTDFDKMTNLFGVSIESIMKNKDKLFECQIFTKENIIVIFQHVMPPLFSRLFDGSYKNDKIFLLNTLFEITSLVEGNEKLEECIKTFFNQSENQFFEFIIQNLNEIKNHDISKMNLKLIDSKLIDNFLSKTSDVIKTVYFLENLCINQPILKYSEVISESLRKVAINKINEKEWDDLSLIVTFLKKNKFDKDIEKLNETQDIPPLIKYNLFNAMPNDAEISIDELLSYILSDPILEQNDQLLELLFNMMLKDRDILIGYLCNLAYKYGNRSFFVKVYLRLFRDEYLKFPNEFIEVTNMIFYCQRREKTLLRKIDFRITNLPSKDSELGKSVIMKLFNSIKEKNGNFQAFLCLRSIAGSFPFLFENYPEEVFNIVLQPMNDFPLIFEKDLNEEQMILLKTAYSAIYFIILTFQSSILADKFVQLFFSRISTLNECQIFCYLIIFLIFFEDEKSANLCQSWFRKLNVYEIIGNLLNEGNKSSTKKGPFSSNLKKTIFLFFVKIYHNNMNLNQNEMIQFEELLKYVEFPLNYIYDFSFSTIPWIYKYDLKIDGISDSFRAFMKNVDRNRSFWILNDFDHLRKTDLSYKEIDDFISKLEKHDLPNNVFNLPEIPQRKSIKMVRHVVMKTTPIYVWILSSKTIPLVAELSDYLANTINELIEIGKNANEDPDDEDNCDVEFYDKSDFLLPYYCQPNLFKNIVREITNQELDDSCFSALCSLFENITKFNDALLFMLEFISQRLTSDISYIEIDRYLTVLENISVNKGFKENFVDLCGNKLLNIILTPEIRRHSSLLVKASNLFVLINENMPIRVTHLIEFLFVSKKLEDAFKLCSKFSFDQLSNVGELVMNTFDNEAKNGEVSKKMIEFLTIFPSIIQERRETVFSLLENLVKKFSIDNKEGLDEIAFLLNKLAPKRGDSSSLQAFTEKESIIPPHIRETSPFFWDFYAKINDKLIELFTNDPLQLSKFNFILSYPELINFNIRSSFFRKKMKQRIKNQKLYLNIDRHNLLMTSFRSLHNKTPDQLLNKFRVDFRGEREIDVGGPMREWFTILAKEIFNQNYGLFDCSLNNKSYQPNSVSYINPNHLEYFKFAGQFIARSLIQGQCIDAHLTTSFCKQILKREPNLRDLEDVDEELYRNLEWMLHNDVEPLYMFFEIDTLELGVRKTIELIENGSEIQVTNENKNEFIHLRTNFALKGPIEQQVNAFCEGFDSLIDHDDIRLFTPNELNLLICGIPEIDVDDFKRNTTFEEPYNIDTPVVKFFFSAISKWDNEKLAKLLLFMTGSSRVPSNGFREFNEMCGTPLKIGPGGSNERIPQSHTCFNLLCLPNYENEEELNQKLLLAIQECNTFEMA